MFENSSWYHLLPDENEDVNKENFDLFFQTMFERQEIWYKRFILKQPAPWTKDKIFLNNKFTNVYRELDRTSQYLIHNVLMDESLSLHDLIFRSIIFRFYNIPDPFESKIHTVKLPHYDNFNTKELWKQTVDYRVNVGNPWSVAYMKNPRSKKPDNWNKPGKFRDDVYCNYIFKDVHKLIPDIVKLFKKKDLTFTELCDTIITLPVVSNFMAHEFFLDFCYIKKYNLRHKNAFPLNENSDTNVGPGCSVGLRMIFPSLKRHEQKQGIYWLRDLADEELKKYGDFKYIQWNKDKKKYDILKNGKINLHNIEMFTCEFQKYMKMKWGIGKQRFKFIENTRVV